MTNRKTFYTLITGASTGLGKQFALECARRNMNLILISLPDENLEELCAAITSTYQVQVSFREMDLTNRISVENTARWINENFPVNMIINNAGLGGSHLFTDSSIEYLYNIIQLNISAMVILTRLLLPQLKKRTSAYILNVSSLAAFSPVPYKTVYPASKAFIQNFSLGLKAELSNTNVNVSVLNPGPILTNLDVSERIDGQSHYVKLSVMKPEKVACIAIRKMLKGRTVIIPGFMNRFNAFFIRLVPVGFRILVGTVIFKRELKKRQEGKAHKNLNFEGS